MDPTNTLDKQKIHRINVYKTVYLSLSFMLLYIAFSTTQNMISQIYFQLGHENLGNYALFALYLAQAANNLFAPKIVQNCPVKWVLFFSCMGYIPFMVVGLLPRKCFQDLQNNSSDLTYTPEDICSKDSIYGFILAAAIITGYCASLIWVCQGTYIGILSSSNPEKTGVYFGIFCSIFATSFLIGSVIGTFLLGYTTQQTFFIIMSIIGAVACLMFLFTPSPYQEYQLKEMEQNKEQERQKLQDEQRLAPRESFMQIIRRYRDILKTEQIVPLMTLMGLSGTILAFYAGYMYMLIQNTLSINYADPDSIKDVNQKTCYVYICQGVFQIVAGYLGAILAQRYNIYRLVNLATVCIQVAFIFALIAAYSYDYTITFLCSAFIGFGDNLLNTVLSEIITRDYQGKSEIYALKSFVMSLVFALLLLINVLVKGEVKYSFILAIFAYQIFSNIASVHLGPQKPLNIASESSNKLDDNEEKKLIKTESELAAFQQLRDNVISTKQIVD